MIPRVDTGPQIGKLNEIRKAAQPRFSPVSGPFWVRVVVRVRAQINEELAKSNFDFFL